jgi:hypothetical protein
MPVLHHMPSFITRTSVTDAKYSPGEQMIKYRFKLYAAVDNGQ